MIIEIFNGIVNVGFKYVETIRRIVSTVTYFTSRGKQGCLRLYRCQFYWQV